MAGTDDDYSVDGDVRKPIDRRFQNAIDSGGGAPSVEQLCHQYVRGDDSLQQTLQLRFAKHAVDIAKSSGLDAIRLDDLQQEAFFAMEEVLAKVCEPDIADPAGYAFVSMRNFVNRWLADDGKHDSKPSMVDIANIDSCTHRNGGRGQPKDVLEELVLREDAAKLNDKLKVLWQAIDALEPEEKRVILARYTENKLTWKLLAEQLDCTVGKVRNFEQKALRKLLKWFEADGQGCW